VTLLVLAALDDVEALWFHNAVTGAGLACTILTTETLSFAKRRSLRVTDAGASATIELTDGTVVEESRISGVLNRMVGPPDAAWRSAAPAERDYASAELHAFMLGWLYSLRVPVRNRPVATFLGGPSPHGIVAAAAACAAGLACAGVEIGTDEPLGATDAIAGAAWRAAGPAAAARHVVCLGGRIIGCDAPDEVRTAVGIFAGLVGAHDALIGVDFADDGRRWWYAGMTPLPRLSTAGPAIVEDLVRTLGAGTGARR
jgi:hypothetical protein